MTADAAPPALEDDVREAVYAAIGELNLELPPERRLAPAPETVLYGRGAGLDSLGLVNLIVIVERRIAERLGRSITIADERAMSQSRSPFRSVATLVEYAAVLLRESP